MSFANKRVKVLNVGPLQHEMRNPQGNAEIDGIHQTLGNIIRVNNYENLDEKDA